jgi:CelD/BcsL family acetyltransferase involved in cellulose biosynthesis
MLHMLSRPVAQFGIHVPATRVIARQPRLSVSSYEPDEWRRIEPVWTELAKSSPHSSFYLSSDWIAAWLDVFGDTVNSRLLVFREGEHNIGVCLLTHGNGRRGPFSVQRMYLNTGGEPKGDGTLMEFNNILCSHGKEESVAKLLGSVVNKLDWDEFVIEGICPGPVLNALQRLTFHKFVASTVVSSTFYIDLDSLRDVQGSYLDTLSANCRSQIRRSLRIYGDGGAIKVEIASDASTAETFFEEMCRMHQARWTARGEPGSFAAARRVQFHRALIRHAYPKGGIHLLRVKAGDETIGILYNFVHNRKICFFQSGFNYTRDPHLKPGLVTHACAIQHYLEQGFGEYDFLAGDARYKRSLASGRRSLSWLVFTRPRIKLSLLELLRVVKHRVQGKSLHCTD